jgi:inosine-uridine nucleoside N-ribohydrolase
MSRRPGLCLVVVLVLASCSRMLAPPRSRPAEAVLPILLDLDMGLDDARVLLALPAQRRYRPVLVTTVEGSASAAVGAANARRLLTAVGLDTVPVASGAPRALRRAVPPPPWRALSEQLGGVELPAPRGPVETSDAPRAIARALRAHAGVRVLALGPLTNLAQALEAEPELVRRIPSLYLLGDFERCDCYNCATDPEAARIVLASGIPTHMVVRAATEALPFDRAFLARVHALPGKAARLVARIMATHAGAPELRLWDDAVLVSLLDPDAVPYRRSATGPFRAERLDPERVRRLLLGLWDAR